MRTYQYNPSLCFPTWRPHSFSIRLLKVMTIHLGPYFELVKVSLGNLIYSGDELVYMARGLTGINCMQ